MTNTYVKGSSEAEWNFLGTFVLDGTGTGELVDNSGNNVHCDKYLPVKVGATTYYVPLYDTKV